MEQALSDRPKREHKGQSLISFPSDYVIIDIETTGLDPTYDYILEIAAVKVVNNSITDRFQTLVLPYSGYKVDSFITELTGITSEMIAPAPLLAEVTDGFLSFIGDSVLIGHNVNFDINFLYDATNERMTNDFVDTMRLSRRLHPDIRHHRLKDLVKYYKIGSVTAHRALADCETTFACYQALCADVIQIHGSYEKYIYEVTKYSSGKPISVTTSNTEFDTSHPLYQKNCVFTGVLEKMIRREAMQIVVDLGGLCQNSVTKSTDYLILGNNDYCSSIKDGKSKKQKKAEALQLQGHDIEILSENTFYDMILDNA